MAQDSCRNFSGFSDDIRQKVEQDDKDALDRKSQGETDVMLQGQGCTNLYEPHPTFDKMECEVVYPTNNGSKNNAYIVFGRDRHTREGFSGYGGKGCTGAGMIDIVVGRGGPSPKHQQIVGPNFFTDAARVYISQRADIDKYFNLPTDETVGITRSENRSAIGIKADAIRIIGREGIRLVTNPRTDSSTPKEFNSRGEKIQSNGADRGIHLIAHGKVGTYDVVNPMIPPRAGDPPVFKVNRLQSMVRGENLQRCLKELVEQVRDLIILVQNFSNSQINFNTQIGLHTHQDGLGVPVLTSPQAVASFAKETIDQLNNHVVAMNNKAQQLGGWYQETYLKDSSDLSFLSRYNKTN